MTKTITTKTGDRMKTSLFGGQRVAKDCLRIETCGSLDELISLLGVIRAMVKSKKGKNDLMIIQRDLMMIAREVATPRSKIKRLPQRLGEKDYSTLEKTRVSLEAKVSLPTHCIIPGEELTSSLLHYARAVSRRCERRIVSLSKKKLISNAMCLKWMNRLSDVLFLLARYLEKGKKK